MYKLFKYKRGIAVDDAIRFLVAFVIFILFIIFLQVNRVNNKKETDLDIRIRLDSIKAEQKLSDFLEKKVKIDEKTTTIDDLIKLYYYEKKHKEILVEEIKNMLNSLSKPPFSSGWNLHIYIMPEDETILKVVPYDILGWFKKESIITYLPLPNNPEKNIKLELWLECQC